MKKTSRLLLFFCFLTMVANHCQAGIPGWKEKVENPAFIHRSLKRITDVMVYDVFSPPVASRIYAYVSIAGYETARRGDPTFISIAGRLAGKANLPEPILSQEINWSIAATVAMLKVGQALVISEDSVRVFRESLLKEINKTGVPKLIFDQSVEYGDLVGKAILQWASADLYKQTRSYERYTMADDIGKWKPTPPAYMKAVEPHWNKIRPFLLDSASQFKPLAALDFSIDTNSSFYREANEVFLIGKELTEEQKDIANFWDCNPFRMNISGHVMFASKKISPGGHWINIAAQACKQINYNFIRSTEVYALLSLTIADAFISCWDEKYRSQVIRPETYINQYINPDWMPLLQTPPFPEYPSGHSVVSAAAAVIMTKIFGDKFRYTDATEVEFGLAPRKYSSFWQAADEAAISRLYGGIHYRAAIVNGIREGTNLAQYIVSRLMNP